MSAKIGERVIVFDGSYGLKVTPEGFDISSIACPGIAERLDLVLVAIGLDLPADDNRLVHRNDCILVDKPTGRVFFHQLRFVRSRNPQSENKKYLFKHGYTA